MSPANRRSSVRKPAKTGDYATYPEGSGGLRDLSPDGAFIEDPDPLQEGLEFDATLHLGGDRVKVHVAVRRSLRRVGMGVEFIRLDPAIRERIKGHLRTMAKSD